jgi:phage head maturation protease
MQTLACSGIVDSFWFRVMREAIDPKPLRSSYNPGALPERTVREVKLFEFGPVTFPAYAAATVTLA